MLSMYKSEFSPEGKCFCSLKTTCKHCMEGDIENVGIFGFLPSQGNSGSASCDNGSPISTFTKETDSLDSSTRFGRISSESKKRKSRGVKSEDCVKLNDGKEKSNITRLKRTEEEEENVVNPRIGKSLVNLLKQKKKEKANIEAVRSSSRLRRTTRPTNEMNEDICYVCHDVGHLVLCDSCPSAFHVKCLGLKGLPKEDLWFCPSCCCGLCGSGETRYKGFIICEQCQIKFHIGCLKQDIVAGSYKGWFCSTKCEQVFSSLRSLVGKEIRVSDDDNLVWRLLKPPEDDSDDADLNSKLRCAVKIMHDCFEPTKYSFNGSRDLIKDVIFGRKSNLKRLNFSGFYTVVLERNKKLTTVATVRVLRDVVEIPLVATAAKYRKRGMCRRLMDELERQMAEIGVYKIVLPAAESLLSTWTERFGFCVVEGLERMKLLKHSFLDFEGTVMCQKVVMKRPDSAKSTLIDDEDSA